MRSSFLKAIIAGIIATTVMTVVMFIAPIMGIPKMNPADMLSGVMGVPSFIGWFMHLMIGVIFAFSYTLIFHRLFYKINNIAVKGALFGFAIFIFAQLVMLLMKLVLPMPGMDGNAVLMMIGSILGHIVFGITVSFILKESKELKFQSALN